jgi:hypothetical protein
LSPELKSYVVQVLEENARLKAENIALREENAQLKGLKGRPKLKPSGMEKSTEARAKGKRKPWSTWSQVLQAHHQRDQGHQGRGRVGVLATDNCPVTTEASKRSGSFIIA